MLSNNLSMNFCYLKIVHILYTRYHPKIIFYKINKRTNVLVHEIILLIIVKMKIKTKNRSHRYDINRPRSKHEHKSHYDDAYMYQAAPKLHLKLTL